MPSQHAKNVALTEKWYNWVNELVENGEYKSASEVMRDGLRSLQLRRERHEVELSEIRSRLNTALKQADLDQFTAGTGEDAINRVFDTAAKQKQQ